MQKTQAALILFLMLGCHRSETAQEAIQRSRASLIDQVNEAGEGAPFFTEKTLNPTWDAQAKIVRMPALSLIDQNGKAQSEALFLGKTSVVAFVFTSCSGFCPFVVQELKKVATPALQIVVITVDPEFDTPERLKNFAAAHKVELWTFLTGSPTAIHTLIRETFVSQVLPRPIANGRDFVHAGHFYVIDGQGRLRGVLNGTEISVAEKARALVRLL